MPGAAPKGDVRPIIIKRKKIVAGRHHGGAWKVAYADFVTAMMAFFLVMWLVTAVSKEQRAALFDYFHNPSMQPGKSVKPAPGQLGPGGASTSPIDLGGGLDAPKSNKAPNNGLGQPVAPPNLEKMLQEEVQIREEKQNLETLMDELKEAIGKSQALEPFKDQLLLDITPEGLRIQIVDKQNRPMFDSGRSRLKDYTGMILGEVAKYLNTVPNRVSLTGHTDVKAYGGKSDYTNWELSADRANAARRALIEGGLAPEKIARVVGLGSAVLFDKKDPMNPINRRISLIVMTKKAEEAALATDSAPAPPADAAAMAPAAVPPGPVSPGVSVAAEAFVASAARPAQPVSALEIAAAVEQTAAAAKAAQAPH
ncbi:MAG: flagellar motor protein MotB [Steroidobacteraceae bacterium]